MKIPPANIMELKGTPYAAVQFFFVNVTAQLATEWLERNKKNRKLKPITIETYARDMKNGEWMPTHQGLAFNDAGELIDGQNRLHGVVQGKTSVMMLVSTGWPKQIAGKKGFTMDAVDMGCGRSLADQLELQHDIKNGKFVAQSAGALAKLICGGFRASKKQSPSSVLAVAGIYKEEFNWLGENLTTTIGLRNISVNGVVLLGLVAWPEQTKKFYEQLKTGLGLKATDPVYHLRNWLLTTSVGNSQDEIYKVRQATSYHLKLFVEGKTAGSLISNSDGALKQLRELNGERVNKIFTLFNVPQATVVTRREAAPAAPVVRLPGDTLPGNWRQRGKPSTPDASTGNNNSAMTPFSDEAVKMGNNIQGAFSYTDLLVRLDGGAKQANLFIAFWKDKAWIESVGPNQYRKTTDFGK